ncbi:hypothetical protein [uncultured Porticoccus sp.]|uniref:hypothetical protein n=1 Tax=uncultured Porticoccus sp. TaxID=1256050 RepID=UPI0034452447
MPALSAPPWIDNTASEVANLDKLTYAGNLESLASVVESTRYHFYQVDICEGAALARRMATSNVYLAGYYPNE